MILIDTREKKCAHIEQYFKAKHISYKMQCLKYADYVSDTNFYLRIDRKQDLNEVARNLITNDKIRFRRECRNAQALGIHIIFLVEHGSDIKTIDDVTSWKSKYSKITGQMLMSEMLRIQLIFGHEFRFCDKRSTPKIIAEILENDKR